MNRHVLQMLGVFAYARFEVVGCRMVWLTVEQATALMHILKLHNDTVSKHASKHLFIHKTLVACESVLHEARKATEPKEVEAFKSVFGFM